MLACINLHKSQIRLFKSSRERAGLFLPDALCLKKKVLTDSWVPGPYSARVQCGCLANEVDYRDYNQTGNISVLVCQSRWENLPVLQCQSELLSFQLVHIYHTTTSRVTVSPRWLKDVSSPWQLMEEGVMVGNLTMGPIPSPQWTLRALQNLQIISCRRLLVKCGRFNLAVFNLTTIIQWKVEFKLRLNPCFVLKCINGHHVWPSSTSTALTSPSLLRLF